MEWRKNAVKAEHEQAQFDPTKQWTIETPVRALNERKTMQNNNLTMKNMLDVQVKHNEQVRQKGRECEIETGKQQVDRDIALQVEEKQVLAFKRHEMAKSLREAWSKQQNYKNNQMQVESLFY